MVTKPWSRHTAKNLLGLGSVEDAFLPDSMDHVIVEFGRNLPRSLWTVHSYHPPVLGTEVTERTLRTSTLTWKRKTTWNVRVFANSLLVQTAGLLNTNITIVETHMHVALPHSLATICSYEYKLFQSIFFLALCMTLCVLPKRVNHINTHTPSQCTHTLLHWYWRQLKRKVSYITILKMEICMIVLNLNAINIFQGRRKQ